MIRNSKNPKRAVSQPEQPTQKPNVYAFIDSQNLNVGTQKFGWKMNWVRFRKFLEDEYGVTKAFMFIGYIPENEALYDQMHDSGFMVVLKPTFDMTRLQPEAPKESEKVEGKEPEEKKPVKGNIDADLVLWTMKELPNYDKAIVVSGDGDFFSLVEYLESEHKLLHLLTPSGHYSQLYNKYEQYVVRLDTYKSVLAYRTQAKRRPAKK